MKETSLKVDEVRERASAIYGCREISSNEHVISYLIGDARVNVYLETGTVGTCRVLNGQVRETFRRNCTLNTVNNILKNPSHLVLQNTPEHLIPPCTGEEEELLNKLELADIGMCILMGEQKQLESHLEDLNIKMGSTSPSSVYEDNTSERDYEQMSGRKAGMELEFSLQSQAMKNVENCLQDIQDTGKLISFVATNGRGTMFLYGAGGVAYTPGVPKALISKVKQAKKARLKPIYVALGNKDRYYVAFHDGSADWKGPKTLDKCLRHKPNPVSVSFGMTYDSFFTVYKDGSWEYQGRGIPDDLEKKMCDRSDRADLLCATLGPSGEWYLQARNGRSFWGGVPEALDHELKNIDNLHFLDFGEDGTYLISYD